MLEKFNLNEGAYTAALRHGKTAINTDINLQLGERVVLHQTTWCKCFSSPELTVYCNHYR